MTKQELVELLYSKEEQANIDLAIPQETADMLNQLGLPVFTFVMDYNTSPLGKLVNLGDKLAEYIACNPPSSMVPVKDIPVSDIKALLSYDEEEYDNFDEMNNNGDDNENHVVHIMERIHDWLRTLTHR